MAKLRWGRVFGAVVVACSVALLGGCLELEAAVTLRADGSGRQTLKLGMTDRVVRTVEASARALDPDRRGADPLAVYDEAKIRVELEEAGLTIDAHRTWRERVREFVEVEAGFTGLAQLRGSPLFGREGEWFVLAGRNPGGLRIVFYPRGHLAWLDAKEKAAKLSRQPTAAQNQFFETQKRRLEGLDVSFSLGLPGAIDYVSDGLIEVDTHTVRLDVDTAGLTSAARLVLALAPRFEIEFDGSACDEAAWKPDAEDPGLVEAERRREASERAAGGRRSTR